MTAVDLTNLDLTMAYMTQIKADIMVLQEPGEVHESRAKRIAEDHGYHAEVVMNKKAGSGNKAGMIIVMGREWQKVKIGSVASKDGQGSTI